MNMVRISVGSLNAPPHLGHLILCSTIKPLMASPPMASTFSSSVLSSMRWSALKLLPHWLHSAEYSLKFSRWPDASKTRSGLITGASSSRKPCLRTKYSFQRASMLRLSFVPRSP